MIESRRTIERQHERREQAARDAWRDDEWAELIQQIEEHRAKIDAKYAEDKRRASLPWWKRAWLWINE